MSGAGDMPRVNGARGAALLGFSIVSLVFGLAFLGPLSIVPPPPAGLVLLDSLVPLQWWGGGWYLAGIALLVGAFKQNQSFAMQPFVGLLAVWGISYGWSAMTAPTLRFAVVFSFTAAIYLGMLIACLGVARLVNAPPVDISSLRRKVLPNELEGRGDEL